MNKLNLACLLILASMCSVVDADINVDEVTKEIGKNVYHRDTTVDRDVQLRQIDSVLEQLNAELDEDPENPNYWVLKGMANWSRLVILSDTLSIPEQQAMKQPTFEAFRKALDLNNAHQPGLTDALLNAMKTLGSPDVRIDVSQRIIDSGREFGKMEEIEFRGGMITSLLSLERFDEVMEQIGIIEQKYPDTEYARGARSYFSEVIEKARKEIEARDAESENNAEEPVAVSASTPEEAESETAPRPEPVAQQPPQTTDAMDEPPMPEEAGSRFMWLIALLGVALASMIMYMFRRSGKVATTEK